MTQSAISFFRTNVKLSMGINIVWLYVGITVYDIHRERSVRFAHSLDCFQSIEVTQTVCCASAPAAMSKKIVTNVIQIMWFSLCVHSFCLQSLWNVVGSNKPSVVLDIRGCKVSLLFGCNKKTIKISIEWHAINVCTTQQNMDRKAINKPKVIPGKFNAIINFSFFLPFLLALFTMPSQYTHYHYTHMQFNILLRGF